MLRIPTLFAFLLLLTFNAFCQNKELKVKFGKLSDKEIAMSSYDADPAASAVILFDKGTLTHRYNDSQGFGLVFERHKRVKVFKKSALNMADFIVAHYKDVKVSEVKASSFHMENGKMVETQLKKENIFEEEITKNFRLTKFLVPAVKEGSIIDITYTMTSWGGLAMPDSWVFQSVEVPTIWSEFKASIPAFLDFKKMSRGWVPYSLEEEKQFEDKLTINYKSRSEGLVASTAYEKIDVYYQVTQMHFIQENVPALKVEDFVHSPGDYLSCVNFDIRTAYDTKLVTVGSTYKLVNGLPTAYNRTWAGMGRDLLDDVYEKDIASHNQTEAAAKSCTAGKANATEKVAAIYEHIGTNYQVKPGYDRIFKSQSLEALVKDKKGSPTDMNLLFINMLDKVGVKAWPVLISTTDNGEVMSFRVSLDEFNRVIAAVQTEGDAYILVDAAAFPNPIGLLSEEDLGSEGLLLKSKEEVAWIPLQNKVAGKSAIIANMSLNPDGSVSGSVVNYESGYSGVANRKIIKEKSEVDMVKEQFKEWLADGSVTELKVEKAGNWNEAYLKSEFKFESTAFTNASGDKLYLSPLMGLGFHENPFKNPERKFNIDLGPSNELNYNLSFKIPEGYKVEEFPKSEKMALLDAITFDYITEQTADQLKFNVRLRQKSRSINVETYADLQQFFDLMTAKFEEQVVLSKL